MQHIDYLSTADRSMRQIEKGAFLTVLAGDRTNVMTIGWASIGFIWGRPMMTVLVRKSRYTWSIIERAVDFTVSVPFCDMQKELEICGAQTGRKVNKLEKSGLEFIPAEKVKTPIINLPGIHYECRIVYKTALDPASLIESYKHLYPEKDFHTLYFGEIVYCYSSEKENKKRRG
ncbi:MAG: flavin reductase family protein [Chitinispirillaceae bacterium]|nr:flavin reductase family protein [Chitinispirillaceae bacterium]